MKHIQLLLIVLSFGISFSGNCQKVKLKKGNVLVGETQWLKYDGCGGFDDKCSLINNAGDEVIFIKFIQSDTSTNMVFNDSGDPNFYEVSFLGLNKKVEIREFFKDIVQLVYNNKVIAADGTLDEDKVDRMVEKFGTPFSDQLNRKPAGNQTIIIRDESPRSGVNINIGR